jgi:hypothetical protein
MYGSIMRARIKDGRRDEYTRFLHEIVPTADDYGQGLHSVELGSEDALHYVEYVGKPLTENG